MHADDEESGSRAHKGNAIADSRCLRNTHVETERRIERIIWPHLKPPDCAAVISIDKRKAPIESHASGFGKNSFSQHFFFPITHAQKNRARHILQNKFFNFIYSLKIDKLLGVFLKSVLFIFFNIMKFLCFQVVLDLFRVQLMVQFLLLRFLH